MRGSSRPGRASQVRRGAYCWASLLQERLLKSALVAAGLLAGPALDAADKPSLLSEYYAARDAVAKGAPSEVPPAVQPPLAGSKPASGSRADSAAPRPGSVPAKNNMETSPAPLIAARPIAN